MKNTTAILLSSAVILVIGGAMSCKTNTAGNNSATPAANVANVNKGNTTVEQPANTNTGEVSVPGSLATPADAYKTAYALRKKGDIEGLKKVMAEDVIEFMTEVGEADNKSLDDMLKEMVKEPQGPTDEVRDVKITGDRATLEYTKKDGSWKVMDFLKVGNDWKMTFPKADELEVETTTKKPK